MRHLLVLGFVSLQACTQFPQLNAQIDDSALDAPFPRLVPIDGIIANAEARTQNGDAQGPAAGRIAALQARAARLRGPIIDAATRARMAQGVNTRAF